MPTSAMAEALAVVEIAPDTPAAPARAVPSRLAWIARGLAVAGWAPMGVFLVHMVFDRGLRLYGRYEWLDMPMHLVGGVAISFFFLACWRAAMAQGLLGRPAPAVTPLVVWLSTCAAAIVWEFAEFGSDRLVGTRVQTSIEDTLSDILFGLIGGLITALASWPRAADAPSPSPSDPGGFLSGT